MNTNQSTPRSTIISMNNNQATPKSSIINIPNSNISNRRVIVIKSSRSSLSLNKEPNISSSCSISYPPTNRINRCLTNLSQVTPIVARIDNLNGIETLKRRIDFDDELIEMRPPSKRQCKCGSTKHSYISHHSCKLNPKKQESSHSIASTSNAAPTKKACKCGSYEHSYISHKSCTYKNSKCICGSSDHKTTRHRLCTLNSKRSVTDTVVETNIFNLITQTQNPLLMQARDTLTTEDADDNNLTDLLRNMVMFIFFYLVKDY
jgi:hypothetical protein